MSLNVTILVSRKQGQIEEWLCPNPMRRTYALADFVGKVIHKFGRRWVVQGAHQSLEGTNVPCAGQVWLTVKASEE